MQHRTIAARVTRSPVLRAARLSAHVEFGY